MKSIALYILGFIISALPLRSDELQIRLFSLKGEVPSFTELDRLIANHRITPTMEWAVPIATDGTISFDDKKNYSYGIKFDKEGNNVKSSTTRIGSSIAGKWNFSEALLSLDLCHTQKLGDHIYTQESTPPIVLPIFSVFDIKDATIVLPSEAWSFRGGFITSDGFKYCSLLE